MSDTTDIEKKSLEAHVELCSERYRALELKFDTVKENLVDLDRVIREVRDLVNDFSEKRNNQILSWGIGIIGVLLAMVSWFATKYFANL